ncbi:MULTISPECIES: TetR/AcrR family transcriptional regulator [unclassified Sphingomonas]|uniref:TetR/AcrR family transcriptional regulator n=1 Tax=unclassified Sphingomonas TaxID=196159 RepID=UPI002269D7DE|nr:MULTISPECIES: TetR/AcrR family transcriptional regulator [unclassified Sphingomonas]
MASRTKAQAIVAPYHHGDLRRALLDAANDILRETGRWDFSLREVARRAGVSHNAPYRHFADKDALLAAIGASGYELMGRSSAAALEGLTDPAALLAALGKAYIAFGVANPALYRLMFGQAFPSNRELPAELLAAIRGAREGLHGVIAAGIADGTFAVAEGDVSASKTLSVSAWAIVHGATLLLIDRIIQRDQGAELVENLPDHVVDLFVAGLRAGRRE